MRSISGQALLLAALAACAACSGDAGKDQGGGTPAADGRSADAPSASQPQDASELVALLDRVVTEAGRLPRAEFDPAALAAKLGKDPAAHFNWVRDNTRWAPYRGLLRGSRGVLLDRKGSNLDRAVLLGDLLRLSGHEVRLAHAELTQADARELLGKLRSGATAGMQPAARPQAPDEQQRIEDQARAMVDAQSSELYAMVKDAAGGSGAAREQAAIDAMRDHWWVERRDNGAWRVMDVLAADAEASSTSAWTATESLPAVPESDWHAVTLRVVFERYANGEVAESPVLERTLRAAEVFDRPIMLVHLPRPWPEIWPDAAADPNALGNAAVNVREWVPLLQVGSDVTAQSGVTDSGDPIAVPFDAKRDISGAGGAGFMSGFGEALGGDTAAASAMTAEWLDFVIQVPGEEAQRVRRPVFDLLGPARRAAKTAGFDANTNELLIARYEALLSATQVLVQVSDLTGPFVTHLGTRSLVENQAAIRELSKERDAVKAAQLAAEIQDRTDIWGPLPALALWRAELGGQPRTSFVDRPNVLSYRIGGPAVNADRILFREQIDVASNSTGVAWGVDRNPFEIRLRQGVADTVAEVLALGGDFRSTQNAAVLFAKAGGGADRGAFIGARDAGAVRGLQWPEDAIGHLGEDVESGYHAVALRQPVTIGAQSRVGWWRIDPKSGETIGVMDTGFHGGMDERVEMELEIVQLRNALRNWLRNNGDRIRAARERANVPWNSAQRGDAELLQTTDRVMDVLHQAAMAGF